MRPFFIFISTGVCAVATLLSAGCAAKRVITKDVQQDSVSVEVRETMVYITDTVEVEIPYVVERNVTLDTISRLENDYAISEAIIEGAYLTHTLATKPQLRRVQIKTPQLRRDSVVYRNFYRDVEVEVERQLSFLQKTQISGFWLLLVTTLFLFFMRGRGRE